MNYPDDLVNEDYDLFFEALGCLRELAYPTYRENCFYASAWNVQIDTASILNQCFCDDTSANLTEAFLQEVAYPEDSFFEHPCLHLHARIFLVFRSNWLLKRVISELLDNFDNFLDWPNHDDFSIM